MTALFQTILQMSATGSIVILMIYIARLFLKRAPKIFSYALWALVLFRLLCPVSITSSFSLIPDKIAQGEYEVFQESEGNADYVFHTLSDPAATDFMYSEKPPATEDLIVLQPSVIPSASLDKNITQQPDFSNNYIPESSNSTINPLNIWAYIWLLGFAGMTGYSLLSLLWVYRKVRICLHIKDNVYLAEDIDTPFTLGFIHPKIYLPSGLSEKEADYIIAHERHHIKRFDPVIKLAAFFALCIHWFNPFAWLAFVLADKDMEMSCDEAVMNIFSEDIRREYASSLLRLASGKRRISMVPLAFGENNIKTRIVNVLNYKKPVFWIMAVAAVLCVVLALLLLTNPEDNDTQSETITTETTTEVSVGEIKYKDVYVNRMYGDLTGDGIYEMIELSMHLPENKTYKFQPELLADFIGQDWATVSVYKGLELDKYEEEPIWVYDGITTVHSGNGQLSLVHPSYISEGEGQWHDTYNPNTPYLMRSSMYTGQGISSYNYQVFSLTEDGEELLVDSYETGNFTYDTRAPYTTELPAGSEVLPEFYEHISKWDTGKVIIAADIGLSDAEVQELMYSLSESNYAGTAAYNPVWHLDYYTRALGTQFATKYFKCEFPGEWAGQLEYRETHDGMVVEIHHKKSVDIGMENTLLGKLFLVPVGQTAADMTTYFLTQKEIAAARYIGENVNGEYIPMACPSEELLNLLLSSSYTITEWNSLEVQEAYNEFIAMGAHFTDMRIAGYATARYDSYVSSGLGKYGRDLAQYPDYGLGNRLLAAPGQSLPLEEPEGRMVYFEAGRYPENYVKLSVDGKDFSYLFDDIQYLNHSSQASWYTTIDLNPNDNSTEIMIYWSGDSRGYNVYVFTMEGDTLSYAGQTGAPAFYNAITPNGDGTFTVLEHTQYIENNFIPVTYHLVNGTLKKIVTDEYSFFELRYHNVVKDLEVYTKRDTASEKVTLKAGEDSVCITKVFTPDGNINYKDYYFYEIITKDGKTYYIYHSTENWLHEYLDNLYLAA